MPYLETILSPALYEHRTLNQGMTVVVVDVLRATTAFCAAFESGVSSILPVTDLDELKQLKTKGYLTAAERDGSKVMFADFGNSPIKFLDKNLTGKKLAYSTTNGTKAIETAQGAEELIIASFSNITAVNEYLLSRSSDILILCAGWKLGISLEDTVCAGNIANNLAIAGYKLNDASIMARRMWLESEQDVRLYCSAGEHYDRLRKSGLTEDLEYCFRLDTITKVPVMKNGSLIEHPTAST